VVVYSPRGTSGIGYDPLYMPNGFGKTFGQLSPTEKDRVSHCARALEKLRVRLSS
jgi:XTP/dITP diphosphohydrolase